MSKLTLSGFSQASMDALTIDVDGVQIYPPATAPQLWMQWG